MTQRAEEYDNVHTLPERYRHFLSLLVRNGSPGVSRVSGQDTGHMARAALPVTASVVAVALGLAIAAALLLAMIRGPFARLPSYVVGGSFATFLVAIGVSYLFGFKLGRAPPSGYCNFFHANADCGGARDWLYHLVVPAALLALFPAVVYARIVREGRSLIRNSKEPERATRRLALPLARVVGRDFGFLIGAAVFVEAAFSLPGIGQMVASGTTAFDRPAVGAALVYAAVLALAVHFVVDLIVAALDSDLRGDWPFAGLPSPLRLSTVPAEAKPVAGMPKPA